MTIRTWMWGMNQRENKPELRLEGAFALESWYGDEVTPQMFRDDLAYYGGGKDIILWINSPGGDLYAGSAMYAALVEYAGHITGRVDGQAASYASLLLQAADLREIVPTGNLMVHNPWADIRGDARLLEKAADFLRQQEETVVGIYAARTGLPEDQIKALMDDETYMNAAKAQELGFVDQILYQEQAAQQPASYMLGMRGVYQMALRPFMDQTAQEQAERQQILQQSKQTLAIIERS